MSYFLNHNDPSSFWSFDLFDLPPKNMILKNGNMQTDIKEKNDGYEMKINLPGIEQKDIKIELDQGFIVISAQINEEKEKKNGEKIVVKERRHGSFMRKYYVGKDIGKSDIKANLKNGVLTLTYPKVESKKESNIIEIEPESV
ncbi:MAG: Hsp20/alpha crystallin family protein [Candidatus Improbicoccus pseudotrichonymphae]|uniref:Hsp20/alpha crystallin family protein n=1 Tax=Candidatus Improbicoccus pseudotrichonymphae TaxID=3033792 RepID=A0AA48IGY0_9FIRM|nr:MAG: Hsp20/alpha crystallin family protein [Candidatus Improbicoccus pseudotrichonymphae]